MGTIGKHHRAASPIGTSGRDSFMHCHGSLQLGVKIPESLVCSMRWRGVDNAPTDADPALASLARKVVALSCSGAGKARLDIRERHRLRVSRGRLRRNFGASDGTQVRIAHTRAGLGTLGPWSDIIKEFGFVLPKHTGFSQSIVEMHIIAH